ncbi:MAG: 23S rRNA (pseudouridine(1915)-N(3))-methyltransferase RlmH [Acidobacteriota bacterium]|nr:23S rRNA (pseudouridine(1915)-N(3))-methyltransferase RlmH [Acidobacteriota bacterium]
MKVFLYYTGKAKDPHANALASDYIERANRYAPSRMTELKPGRSEFWSKHPTATKILLDPAGQSLDSEAFSKLFSKAEMLGHDLVFVVGGHDGLPSEWKSRADLLVSLSAMTMPHELARAVVAEQIYRSFTMLRGHPYPR